MFNSCETKLSGKKGLDFSDLMDGAMENGCITEDKCKEDGAVLVADGVICQEEPMMMQ